MISLGIDIGGTGCKCVAFDETGAQLALSYAEYPLTAGTVSLSSELLLAASYQVIRQCAAQLPNREAIRAVAVSSFGESFVALGEDGEALDDVLLYFGSGRSDAFADLVERVGAERFMQIARILPDASYSLSRMLHTIKTADKPVWKFLFIAGFVCYRLCGNPVSDGSLACRSLLYDVEQGCWSEELLEKAGIREEQLPVVLPTGSAAGTILPDVAAHLGLPKDTRVVIGAHDQIVNALGAGVQEAGEAADTSGTCECITPLFRRMPRDLGFQKNNFACVPYLCDAGFVTYAYNISAGSVVRWFRDALGGALKAEAEQSGGSVYDVLNRACPAEPTELMVLPFLQGMGGTPDVDATATGLLAGLTTRTRLPDIYRAILEGVTFEMRYNQEKLKQAGVAFDMLYACGGGARSSAWLQIKADILGCRILPVKAEETGAMGSAILGIAAVTGEHVFAAAKRFRRYAQAVEPNPERAAYYDERYRLYRALRAVYLERKTLFYS